MKTKEAKSALKSHFNYGLDQNSPVVGDVERLVNYDEDGVEYITYGPVDYKKIGEELGSVREWSLNALLKAGIDPNFPIHTGSYVSRVEGVNDLFNVDAAVNDIISSLEPNNEVENEKE